MNNQYLSGASLFGALLALIFGTTARADSEHGPSTLATSWPIVDEAPIDGVRALLDTADPFSLRDAATGQGNPRQSEATLFLPNSASSAAPAPGVIFLHGAGGIQRVREITYARQLAAQGVAALVIDVFGNRRDLATGFIERVLNITEAMYLADAYAGLAYLDARADVDGGRVALVGFSYGGMATIYAAHRQIAEIYLPNGPRFAGHAAYYAPCVAKFELTETTGAPVLMMWGTEDLIVDPDRCHSTIADLRGGGSAVEWIAFDGAFHQWDGGFTTPRLIGRDLSPCALRVGADGIVRDLHLGLVMNGPLTRRAILAACVRSEPYMIGADDHVRALSTAALSRFLNDVFAP